MLQLSNCYKLLHLEEDCSDLELRQRYRKIALELHPDKLKHDDSQSQRDSNQFLRLSQAYKLIKSFRQQMKAVKTQKQSESLRLSSSNIKLMSFRDIKDKIMDLSKIVEHNNAQINHCSNFNQQIDTLYDQHLNLIQKISQKLRLMRRK